VGHLGELMLDFDRSIPEEVIEHSWLCAAIWHWRVKHSWSSRAVWRNNEQEFSETESLNAFWIRVENERPSGCVTALFDV
jgi:hypothetical protein